MTVEYVPRRQLSNKFASNKDTCGPNFLRSRMIAWKKQSMKTTDLVINQNWYRLNRKSQMKDKIRVE